MRKTALPKQPATVHATAKAIRDTATIQRLESELATANETIRTTEAGLRKLSDEVAASREAVQAARRETEALLDAKDKEIERLESALKANHADYDQVIKERNKARSANESQFKQGELCGRQAQRKETRELLGKESVAIQKHLDGQRFGERWADFITGYAYLKLFMDGKFNQLVQAHLEPREPRPKDANEVEYPRFERVRKEEFN